MQVKQFWSNILRQKCLWNSFLLVYILFTGLPPSYESHVGAKDVTKLVQSDQFKALARSTTLLKHIDLGKLTMDSERLCFMINLYNLMFTHGILVIIGGLLNGTPKPEENIVNNWTYESVMEKSVGRLAIHQYLCYQVGQMGIFR